eukprot:2480566-Heterocapsa_arctica.AAC.1
MAAAAVSTTVPLGGLVEPSPQEQARMASAIVNGPRQNSKIAKFRRKIKDCLTHRPWTTRRRMRTAAVPDGLLASILPAGSTTQPATTSLTRTAT